MRKAAVDRRGFLAGATLSLAAVALGGTSLGIERGGRAVRERIGAAVADGPSGALGRRQLVWSVPTSEPMVALTFDDGPDPELTARILAVLDRYRVQATFNVMGYNASRHGDLLRAVVAGGHELGNHTWTHQDLAFLSTAATPAAAGPRAGGDRAGGWRAAALLPAAPRRAHGRGHPGRRRAGPRHPAVVGDARPRRGGDTNGGRRPHRGRGGPRGRPRPPRRHREGHLRSRWRPSPLPAGTASRRGGGAPGRDRGSPGEKPLARHRLGAGRRGGSSTRPAR